MKVWSTMIVAECVRMVCSNGDGHGDNENYDAADDDAANDDDDDDDDVDTDGSRGGGGGGDDDEDVENDVGSGVESCYCKNSH